MFLKLTPYAGDGSSVKYVNTDTVLYIDSYKDPDEDTITVLHLSNGEELEVRESVDFITSALGLVDALKTGRVDILDLMGGVLAKHEK